MGLAGGVFSLLLHFHPQSLDGASVLRSSPAQIMEQANMASKNQYGSALPMALGSHVELLTSAPRYKDDPLATGAFIEPPAYVIFWSMEKRRRQTNLMA